ncbi:hypothetical protein DCCM_2342 [Desulfocucumis palustris]|uniref:Uncharacterized protein n=1 Tax=Desulfocucumis palustris TaxID=1898651 RepID=A0A2L2XC24_9FIRM|nr:hypothetical protein DCCM_2342 [Desulfocucumis palustris]
MIKIDRNKLKKIPKMCILEEGKLCDNCCECFVCDLDPTKTCDNCAKCIELADYNSISIDDILLHEEVIIRFSKNGKHGTHKKNGRS